MKKYWFFLFALLCHAHDGMSQNKESLSGKYVVTGRLSNVPDGTAIGLYEHNGNLIEPVGQDTLRNGTFTFSDTISSTKMFLLLSSDKGFPSNWLNVWVAPGKHVTISGRDKLLPTWRVESDIPEQVEENSFQSCSGEVLTEWAVQAAVEADCLKEFLDKEHAGDEEISRQGWAKVDSIRKLSTPLQRLVFKKEIDYMGTAPAGRVWMDRLVLFSKMSVSQEYMPYLDELKELYARLPETMKQTPDGQLAYQYLFPVKTVGIGDEMADGTLYDVNGAVHRLGEFKGKYILIDFWSRGCGPCIESLPELEKIGELYRDSLALVSISIDPEKQWKEFIDKKKMAGNQWNELRKGNTGLAASYGVRGYPHYVLIAPDGRVKDIWNGYGTGSLLGRMKKNLE